LELADFEPSGQGAYQLLRKGTQHVSGSRQEQVKTALEEIMSVGVIFS
jgi:hypothetical protein